MLLASEVAIRSCSRRGGSWASQVDTTRQASKSSKILPILATGASASRSAGSRPTGKRSSVWQQHSQQSRSRQGLLERGMVQPVSSNVPTYIDVKALRARFRPSAAPLQHGTPTLIATPTLLRTVATRVAFCRGRAISAPFC